MFTLFAAILGAVTGILPGLVEVFKLWTTYKYEIQLKRLELDAARDGYEFRMAHEDIRASYRELESLHRHDNSLRGNRFVEILRASVRPVITYLFFFWFMYVQGAAIYLMYTEGLPAMEIILLSWSTDTAPIFAAVMGFWFGGRQMSKYLQTDPFSMMMNRRSARYSEQHGTSDIPPPAPRRRTPPGHKY